MQGLQDAADLILSQLVLESVVVSSSSTGGQQDGDGALVAQNGLGTVGAPLDDATQSTLVLAAVAGVSVLIVLIAAQVIYRRRLHGLRRPQEKGERGGDFDGSIDVVLEPEEVVQCQQYQGMTRNTFASAVVEPVAGGGSGEFMEDRSLSPYPNASRTDFVGTAVDFEPADLDFFVPPCPSFPQVPRETLLGPAAATAGVGGSRFQAPEWAPSEPPELDWSPPRESPHRAVMATTVAHPNRERTR